jgi:hypothetical protein
MPALLRLVMVVIKPMLGAQNIPFGRASGTCQTTTLGAQTGGYANWSRRKLRYGR